MPNNDQESMTATSSFHSVASGESFGGTTVESIELSDDLRSIAGDSVSSREFPNYLRSIAGESVSSIDLSDPESTTSSFYESAESKPKSPIILAKWQQLVEKIMREKQPFR